MSADTSPVHIYSAPGIYIVCQKVSNAYSSNTICHEINVQVLANEEIAIRRSVDVWPNPTTGKIFLPAFQNKKVEVRVFDMTGKLLFTKITTDGRLDIAMVPAGIYLLKIASDRQPPQAVRVVVAH
jgi:PKD repeat protein